MKNLKFKALQILRFITSDKAYIKIRYFIKFKKFINLKEPVTFNEKINWLKLYGRNNDYGIFVDKYEVRQIVSEKIGCKYLIPILGIYENTEEINFDRLPNSFVLKGTHGSGWVIICKDKNNIDKKEIKEKLNYWLSSNFYLLWGEWYYKYIKPRVICEEFMGDELNNVPKDFKFYCFNGQPKMIHVDFDRFNEHTRNFYDLEWNRLPFSLCYPNSKEDEARPSQLDTMIEISKKLSDGFKFIRIDLYEIKGEVYFGEMTFFPDNGLGVFNPREFDLLLGNYLKM